MSTSKVFGGYLLGGAYKGKNEKKMAEVMLCHAVSDSEVNEGRLHRSYGEAFCNRNLNIADEGSWVGGDEIDCPRCLDILKRIGTKGV